MHKVFVLSFSRNGNADNAKELEKLLDDGYSILEATPQTAAIGEVPVVSYSSIVYILKKQRLAKFGNRL